MTRWWMSVAGVALAGMVAVGPSRAAEYGAYPDDYGYDNGSDDVWASIGWGTLTVLGNLVYVPAKLAYAGVGAVTGGMALGVTGGDLQTAQQIWEPSLFGDYFLTPGMIRGEEGISFAGAPAELSSPMPDPGHGYAEGSDLNDS